MIILCTDYGCSLYAGQLHARILQTNDRVKIIDGVDDLPAFNIRAAAYLLDALIDHYPPDSIFVAVVDPGVGSERAPIYFQLEDRWFVGPDNGIFSRVLARDAMQDVEIIKIDTAGFTGVSTTFHGRDLFAPAAAMLAQGSRPAGTSMDDSTTRLQARQWPENLNEIVYIDAFGNCMTGVGAETLPRTNLVKVGDHEFSFAKTFSSRPSGAGFWHMNSLNLVEIAASQSSAADVFGISVGDRIKVTEGKNT